MNGGQTPGWVAPVGVALCVLVLLLVIIYTPYK